MTKIRKANGVKLTAIILLVYAFAFQVSAWEGQINHWSRAFRKKNKKQWKHWSFTRKK
ncbi:MAG: hypothetical protein GTO45_37950 [Candidatus Aminicenantes bacterium]|nr:hypothetical protein [Candidatus Aminicenantes bacterium]NIM80488.1 hypothetical protein [Candidatus Aminicenantes bacterium]NIN23930.1 hypothetical protein [Candidatus Aminicenantes bacterium]NIN47644.1 hypothetical protein [Candidatus Aminicenantes bacterium]NIN90574.1 hypothetical protein [Candidatus Aminicenantes bacterium]